MYSGLISFIVKVQFHVTMNFKMLAYCRYIVQHYGGLVLQKYLQGGCNSDVLCIFIKLRPIWHCEHFVPTNQARERTIIIFM